MKDLEPNKSYIVRGTRPLTESNVSKYKVIEVTKETYLFENVDTGCKFRMTKNSFENNHKVIEIVDEL